jgi:hypothetical protein
MHRFGSVLALSTLLLLPSTARAQEPPRPQAPPASSGHDADDADAEKRRQLRRRIQALRMARLTQELDLDDATAAKLFPLINKIDDRGAELAESRGKVLRKLDELSRKKDADSKEIDAALDEVTEISKKAHALDEELHAKARAILTPAQMAKFILFHEHFQDEMHGVIKGARDEERHEKAKMLSAQFEKLNVEMQTLAANADQASPEEREKIHQRMREIKQEMVKIKMALDGMHGDGEGMSPK